MLDEISFLFSAGGIHHTIIQESIVTFNSFDVVGCDASVTLVPDSIMIIKKPKNVLSLCWGGMSYDWQT